MSAATTQDASPYQAPIEVHRDGESPWPKISAEFDAKVLEEIQKPFDYKSAGVSRHAVGQVNN